MGTTSQPPKNPFELLRDKKILAILDGDESFGEMSFAGGNGLIKNSLPYLSGPEICGISTRFGFPVSYGWGGGAQSRWAYLDDLLVHCIKAGRVSDLLGFLFSKEQFAEKLRGNTPVAIEQAHKDIIRTVIEQINGVLYFGGNELVMTGKTFAIHKIGTPITVAAPAVKVIDISYIADLSARAMKDVSEGNYDSALTKSRTLLEEVFCYVIEKKGEAPSESGDIGKLYNQVKQLYNMHQDKDVDKRINNLLSGFEKIISSIAEMRNKGSDSHGVGGRRINISEHHARLFVNAAMTMADFILSVGANAKDVKEI